MAGAEARLEEDEQAGEQTAAGGEDHEDHEDHDDCVEDYADEDILAKDPDYFQKFEKI